MAGLSLANGLSLIDPSSGSPNQSLLFPLLGPDGSPTAPTYAFSNQTNTGISRSSSLGIILSHAGVQLAQFLSGPSINIGQSNVAGASNFVFGGGNTNNIAGGQQYGNTLMIGRNINVTKGDDSMVIGALANNVTNIQDGAVIGSSNTWSAGVDGAGRPTANGYVFGLSNSITLTNGATGAVVTAIGQGNTYSSSGGPSLALFGNGLTNARGLPDFLSKGIAVIGSGDGLLNSTTYSSWDSDIGVITHVPKGNIVEQLNGINAQTFRIYNTYTNASNYERGIFSWSANNLVIGAESAGTGTNRTLQLRAGTFTSWSLLPSGTFQAVTDNTYDVGAFGANRPRNIYAGSTVFTTAPTAQGAATYTVLGTDNTIINSVAATLTLPAVASSTGRRIRIVTTGANAIISNASNVVPITGGAAGTAILAATAGKWADLECNGTNWIITASN